MEQPSSFWEELVFAHTEPDRTAERWVSWVYWVSVWGLAALCFAVLHWSLPAVAARAYPPLLVVLVSVGVLAWVEAPPGADPRPHARRWGWIGAVTVPIVLSVGVIGAVSIPAAFVSVVALTVTSPLVRDVVTRRCRTAGSTVLTARVPSERSVPGRGDVRMTSSELAAVDTDFLCRMWRETSCMAHELDEAARLARLSDLRRDILDELEARHPDEVGQWLEVPRHGAEGPARYLR